MKKTIFALVFGLFLLAFVSSSFNSVLDYSQLDSLPNSFDLGGCANLIQSCADCSYNNISSIISPSGDTVPLNAQMTKTGIDYNYSYCDLFEQGIYVVQGFGDPNDELTSWVYAFEVKRKDLLGLDFNSVYSYTAIIILLILSAVAFIFGKLQASGFFLFIVGLYLLFNSFVNFISIGVFCLGIVLLFSRSKK